ncbi:zinc ribbon domain-containing protein [Thermofilum sp.]|jgi:cytoskeletal protein CcmA (bactofilin family)|uniref:zinc ribbon domain-containing protein n=1 Tax=Thermofilum sp. TaxID=1961369 RepID=UPI00258A52B3|nr:zinc ribbon domain-containing protein [Thermofilum sp.]
MSIVRRFPQTDKLSYDPISDTAILLGDFIGATPVVGVRKAELSSGAILLNELQAFEEVVINGNCIVKGGVSSPRITIVTSGATPTIILGDIYGPSSEKREAASLLRVQGDGEAFIQGTIISDRIEFSGRVTVVGDIFALQELKIEGPALVMGRVMVGSEDSPGRAYISRSTIYQLFATGEVVLGEGVTLVSPVAVVKGGRILWRDSSGSEKLFSEAETSSVRVFSFPCLFCPKVRNPLLCEKYLDGECDAFESLRSYDYSSVKEKNMSVLSWMWRASPSIVAQNLLAKRMFTITRSLYNPRVDTGSRKINEIAHTEYPSYIIQEALTRFREAAGTYAEVVKKTLTDLLEDYYKKNNKEYIRCPKCGVPNPVDAKICIYCGEALGGKTA